MKTCCHSHTGPRLQDIADLEPRADNTSSTNLSRHAAFFLLDHKYKISWECAELLIELGGGPPAPVSQPNASTGRNDLSQRQLWHLRDMLNKSDSSPTMLANLQIPEEGTAVNRTWRWGEATSSTITLPSEESGHNSSSAKKRRYSRI